MSLVDFLYTGKNTTIMNRQLGEWILKKCARYESEIRNSLAGICTIPVQILIVFDDKQVYRNGTKKRSPITWRPFSFIVLIT